MVEKVNLGPFQTFCVGLAFKIRGVIFSSPDSDLSQLVPDHMRQSSIINRGGNSSSSSSMSSSPSSSRSRIPFGLEVAPLFVLSGVEMDFFPLARAGASGFLGVGTGSRDIGSRFLNTSL